MTDIATAIKALARNKGAIPTIVIGEVTAFDATKWLATITFNIGFSDDDIRVKAVINSETEGIFIEPIIGSKVLCGCIEGSKESMVVLTWSEIKRFRIIAAKTELNGDTFKGLVKIQQLETNLNSLKNAIESLKTAVASGITAVGAGPAANGATGAAAFNSAAAPIVIQFQDMENQKVTHG